VVTRLLACADARTGDRERRRDAGDDLDEAIASAQSALEFALSEFLAPPEAKLAGRIALRYMPGHLRDQIERRVART
jgi:hypothetical protein